MISNRVTLEVTRWAQRIASQVRRNVSDRSIQAWSGLRPGDHDIDPSVQFRNPHQIALSRGIVIKAGAILNGRSKHADGIRLGHETYLKERAIVDAYGGHVEIDGPAGIAQDAFFHGGAGINIGAYFIAGPACKLIASNHAFVSKLAPIMLQGDRYKDGISIGNNVWLGAGVIVLDGSKIGNNVVVGAGTIVHGTIPSDSVVQQGRDLDIQPIRFR